QKLFGPGRDTVGGLLQQVVEGLLARDDPERQSAAPPLSFEAAPVPRPKQLGGRTQPIGGRGRLSTRGGTHTQQRPRVIPEPPLPCRPRAGGGRPRCPRGGSPPSGRARRRRLASRGRASCEWRPTSQARCWSPDGSRLRERSRSCPASDRRPIPRQAAEIGDRVLVRKRESDLPIRASSLPGAAVHRPSGESERSKVTATRRRGNAEGVRG